MSQTSIELRNVGVDFPVFNAWNHSFKNRVLSAVTGGAIDRKYDGSVVVRGLQNINLKIEAGERVGLIGHNGAGKTTMLRVLSGIYAPTEGEARINGECVSLINISLGIDPEATGRENIKLRSAMIGFTPKETRDRMEEIIDFSGLGDFIDMPFRTYSSGMQLRLAFAVSTSIRPQILVLDEWLSTGDEEFRHRAERRMREVVDSTDILILASHSRQLLEENCNRVVLLEQGRVILDSIPSEACKAYFERGIIHKLRHEQADTRTTERLKKTPFSLNNLRNSNRWGSHVGLIRSVTLTNSEGIEKTQFHATEIISIRIRIQLTVDVAKTSTSLAFSLRNSEGKDLLVSSTNKNPSLSFALLSGDQYAEKVFCFTFKNPLVAGAYSVVAALEKINEGNISYLDYWAAASELTIISDSAEHGVIHTDITQSVL